MFKHALNFFHAALRAIANRSDYKLFVALINKSSLPLAAIVEQSELIHITRYANHVAFASIRHA